MQPPEPGMTRQSFFPSLLVVGLSIQSLVAADPALAAEKRGAALKRAALLQEAFAQVADEVFPGLVCLTSFERTAVATDEERDGLTGWREAISVDQRYRGMKRLASATGFALSDDGYILSVLDFLKKPDGEL